MLSIIYTSSATTLFSDAELVDLPAESQANNATLDITGLLLYHDGNFMQVIEGPDAAVLALYAKIQNDSRHHSIMRLSQDEIPARQFADWRMGFRNVNALSETDKTAFSPFLLHGFTDDEFRRHPMRAYILLLSFKNLLR